MSRKAKKIKARNKQVEKYKKDFRELYFQLMSDREKLYQIVLDMKECSSLIDEMMALMKEEIDLYSLYDGLAKKRHQVFQRFVDSVAIHDHFGRKLYDTLDTVKNLLELLGGYNYPSGDNNYSAKDQAEAQRFQSLLNSDKRFSNLIDVSELVEKWSGYKIPQQMKKCVTSIKVLATKLTQEFSSVWLDVEIR